MGLMAIDFTLAFWSQYFYLINRNLFPVPAVVPQVVTEVEDPVFQQYWRQIENDTLLDSYRAKRLWDLATEAKDLDGDFIECGSYRGGMSFLMGFFIKHHGLKKKVYLCDSFQGLPAPDTQRDTVFQRGQLATDVEACRRRINELGLSEVVVMKPGWFSETLPTFANDQRFAWLHIDCDLYKSAETCFDHLYNKAATGAPIIIDDYHIYSPGVQHATKALLQKTGECLELGPFSQAYFRKGKTEKDTRWMHPDTEGFLISYRDLADNRPYRDALITMSTHLKKQGGNLDQLVSRLAFF